MTAARTAKKMDRDVDVEAAGTPRLSGAEQMEMDAQIAVLEVEARLQRERAWLGRVIERRTVCTGNGES